VKRGCLSYFLDHPKAGEHLINSSKPPLNLPYSIGRTLNNGAFSVLDLFLLSQTN
jgi:hypothetical protein